ncbi:hypothetical protein Mal4_52960 [Maioricimonas rarisocia]|uniref:Neutral/alkaline non-lysosomal ceramidase n=1 Tax=Maioricimonas rarisocia TaxID=2528026 RepID=A0A517ZEK2_9PLAN|nr:hypothetical protein [Maioricimonas rarisocia]QDU40933.1 hypothetical protein Mal4_52960 [Maioricimonas rarisocia]
MIRCFFLTASLVLCLAASPLSAGELAIGAATVSITPNEPVALSGQLHTRVAREVESEVTATALALESRGEGESGDQAILIACDLVAVRDGIIAKTREKLRDRLPGFDVSKLIVNATHTHTGPVTREGRYEIPEGVMTVAEYVDFLTDRLADVAVQAWESRQPGSVGWGLGHAVIAQNRRSLYANGTAQMYGRTNAATFRGIEGPEDHGVEVLFFWNGDDELIATAVNVACPSQEVEGRSNVNADFWHEVRETLRKKHGEQLHVLGWTGVSGDQSPHLMYRKAAEERMRRLRGLTRLEELARRIVRAWEDAYEGARQEMHADAVLIHKVIEIELPLRPITEDDVAEVKAKIESLSGNAKNAVRIGWHREVLHRYAAQQAGTAEPYRMELHAIRLGDIAIATNDFELFTQFGIQMKSRSRALQTFLIQLAGPGTYIPTAVAAAGGGYSAIVESNVVGAEGGQVLTDRTVELINSLWED